MCESEGGGNALLYLLHVISVSSMYPCIRVCVSVVLGADGAGGQQVRHGWEPFNFSRIRRTAGSLLGVPVL